jgi:hypothetical protein
MLSGAVLNHPFPFTDLTTHIVPEDIGLGGDQCGDEAVRLTRNDSSLAIYRLVREPCIHISANASRVGAPVNFVSEAFVLKAMGSEVCCPMVRLYKGVVVPLVVLGDLVYVTCIRGFGRVPKVQRERVTTF